MTSEKKRYWLKLDKNFLKSSQIKVIKNMQNGKDYIIFYLSLLLESIETVGHLRFSDLVPYNEEMLSSVTDTNVDIVRSAVKIFQSLGLLEIFDDGTIFMTQVAQMTGKESESAERVRQYRLREREKIKSLQCNGDVTESNDNKDKQTTENNINEHITNNIQEEQQTENTNIETFLPVLPSNENKQKNFEKEFDKLWEYYPNKKGKDQAKNKYILARKNGTTYEEIAQGLKNYLKYIKDENIESKYIKHGSTWFNQKCWNDDYKTSNTSNKKSDGQMELLKGVYDGTIKIS